MSNTENTLNLIEDAVVMMNKEIRSWGTVEKDWNIFWKQHLHSWSTNDMINICEVIYKIQLRNKGALNVQHLETLERVIMTLKTHNSEQKVRKKPLRNVMDIPKNKHTYWKFVMSMREIWNNVHDAPLPMAKVRYDIERKQPLKTVFTSDLFKKVSG